MRSFQFFAGLAAVTTVIAIPSPDSALGKFSCGTKVSADFISRAQRLKQLEESGEITARSAAATVTVDTYFHVLAQSSSESGGYLSESTLSDQLDVMNEDFAAYGFQFNLVDTDWTVNSNWANDGAELTMKKSLRQGGYDALNIYFVYDMDYLGYAYLPDDVTTGSNDYYYDGVTIISGSLPGGSITNYNLGKTATHEVGHWLGLLHTFEGESCSGSGDEVSDTPQQLSATEGCPTGRDSCPNVDGLDPITNYMDYSYDSCYEEFTDGQTTRMSSMWSEYRA